MSQPVSLNAYPRRSGFVTLGTGRWEKSDPLSSEAHLPSCSEPASNHSHVYYSYRLHIVNSRITASGTVDKVIEEADGDAHLRTNLDQAYSNLTNTANDQYQYGDLVVEKQRMSSFNSTTLDTKLRGLGVTTVVCCGAWTNWAVEHTCRDAADHGYEVVVVTDATATISEEFQRAALDFALTTVATRATADEVLAALA